MKTTIFILFNDGSQTRNLEFMDRCVTTSHVSNAEQFFRNKPEDFSSIKTQIVRVEGEHADH